MALFHDRGYEGVGVAELSTAIGVNPPSLYAAFGSKKGLFGRALELYAATTGGVTAATLAEPGPVVEAVPWVLTRLVEIYGQPGGLRGCLRRPVSGGFTGFSGRCRPGRRACNRPARRL